MSGAPMRCEVQARIVGPGVSEASGKATRISFDTSTNQSPELPPPGLGPIP